MVNEILAVACDDGLEFDPTATTAATIRDDDLYGGVRTTVHGSLSTFVVQFHVDVNLGDPLWPTPEEVDVPRLLGGVPIRMRGYRIELILAEKIVSAIQRGTANTRWRDFVDIAACRLRRCGLSGALGAGDRRRLRIGDATAKELAAMGASVVHRPILQRCPRRHHLTAPFQSPCRRCPLPIVRTVRRSGIVDVSTML